MPKMTLVNVRLHPRSIARLDMIARQASEDECRTISRTEVIRRAIDQYLAKEQENTESRLNHPAS